MNIPIQSELRSICKDIESKNLDLSQWSEIESDDLFQLGDFIGGFDAEEKEFCFSYYAPNKNEYWFQFNHETAKEIALGKMPVLIGRPAE